MVDQSLGTKTLNAGAAELLVNSTAWLLKNAIDWSSRPSGMGPMRRKPVAIMGCATGVTGTRRA